MKSYEEIYREWRWLTYNQLNDFRLDQMVDGSLPINIDNKYSYDPSLKNYTKENVEKYINRQFDVSKDLINAYDDQIMQYAIEWTDKYSSYYFGSFYFLRSKFIENCYLDISNFYMDELIDKIKNNIIYYHWWDELTFDQLTASLINNHFLKSTSSLISESFLKQYIQNKFTEKNNLINQILNFFEPRYSMIQEMNVTYRSSVVFNYNWLFNNDLNKAIRIFENECRIDHNEKIIGSFYNEDLLFREVKKIFGKKFNVISQGSPEWLGIQRFDIYLPELNIAIEYQGEQHQRPVDFGGKGKEKALQQFNDNIKRDKLKKEKAKNNQCILIYVYPDYDIKKVIKDLKSEIQKQIENKRKASM